MEITCLQMDVLISFYIEGELSQTLKEKVQEHLRKCPNCRAKYNIITSLLSEIKSATTDNEQDEYSEKSSKYGIFQNNLSAYIDNELNEEESVKVKKYAISNKKARKELEDVYNIRKLMNDSFKKTKMKAKNDFSKKIMREMNLKESSVLNFNPLIRVAFYFIMTTLVLSAIIIFCLSLG